MLNKYIEYAPGAFGILLLSLLTLILFIRWCDANLEYNKNKKFAPKVVEAIERKINMELKDWMEGVHSKPREFLYPIRCAHSSRPPLIWVVVLIDLDGCTRVEVEYQINLPNDLVAEAQSIADLCRSRGFTTSCFPAESVPSRIERWV